MLEMYPAQLTVVIVTRTVGFYSSCCLWSNDRLPLELLLCYTAALVV